MGEDSRQRGRHTFSLALLQVNPRLSVVLGAVWVRGYCLLPCIYLHGATRAQGTLKEQENGTLAFKHFATQQGGRRLI